MRTREEIVERISQIEEKLKIIEKEINKELLLPFHKRDIPRCRFLDLENKRYTMALEELEWIVNE